MIRSFDNDDHQNRFLSVIYDIPAFTQAKMAQPYRIQDSRIGKRIQPQSIQDNNTGVARNRFSRRGDRILRKNSGRRDVISFSVEEAGETSMNSNESTPTVIESSDSEKEQIQPEHSNNPPQNYTQNFVQPIYIDIVDDGETSMNNRESALSIEVIELSDSEEQVQPENSNNSSSQNDTQNAIERIYIDLVDDNEENEENEGQTEIIYISDEEEELDYDNMELNIMENQAEIRRRIHLYGQIRPQTEEEREYSPSPREGFTTDLDKDTIVICSRCNHGMENGMCALYCGHVVCGDCGTLYEKDRISFCRVCKEYTAKDEVTRLFF
ncbi:12583_t:CDS:1 [Ambispora leptoticha]|uniref:12583_t:CDS:1 n=1 Tax=Ambispora leptoticha TaxID=144679 RepID=A0A9N9GFP8_9GLOM|nr:12583_t:CDS:1 [Ambispora leptoticha]